MESWNKSDTICIYNPAYQKFDISIGNSDLSLARRLILAGTDHSKFMRQITVSVDITAPLYWWKEFDTYKVGTVANSTSTMHKLAATPITPSCFEMDDYADGLPQFSSADDEWHYTLNKEWNYIIDVLESMRRKYLETQDIRYWKELIRLLPESWLQMRTVTMSYQNLRAMYFARRNHKLSEWHRFCDWIDTLPYAVDLIKYERREDDVGK